MKAAIIIPARYASTRLPGKPLLKETGKPLIQHTYEQALRAKRASSVVVATDDGRIADAVNAFGGTVVMTAADHTTGSARVAEAAATLDADIIVNLQGDEPEIDPAHIDKLIEIASEIDCFAATLVCPFDIDSGPGSPDDPSAVKAILGEALGKGVYRAQYFTRHICAFPRATDGGVASPAQYNLHIGIYAFPRANLLRFAAAPPGALETIERLEQLRILEMGEAIAAARTGSAPAGIDTPEDYQAFVRRCAEGRA